MSSARAISALGTAHVVKQSPADAGLLPPEHAGSLARANCFEIAEEGDNSDWVRFVEGRNSLPDSEIRCESSQPAVGSGLPGQLPAGLSLVEPSGRTRQLLDDVISVYRRHLLLEDDYPLLAVLATYAASRLPLASPVWLMIVGQSSGGKTESIMPLDGLPGVVVASSIQSVGALLSGTSTKERAVHAKGGLLRELGKHGLLLLKDFTSTLQMHRESRGEVLSALREVYDGKYVRFVGSDGGQRLEWEGRPGLIAACTPVLDDYHEVAGLMGERFITVRLPMLTEEEVSRRAVDMMLHGSTARLEMHTAVERLFESLSIPGRLDPPEDLIPTLHAMARLVALGRAAVNRDGRFRDIISVPGEEGPGRLVGQFVGLLFGLETIGCVRDVALRVLRRVAFDCIPQQRAALIRVLLGRSEESTTKDLASELRVPTKTASRTLEDLWMYQLAVRHPKEERARQEDKDGRAVAWEASPLLRELWRGTGQEGPF